MLEQSEENHFCDIGWYPEVVFLPVVLFNSSVLAVLRISKQYCF